MRGLVMETCASERAFTRTTSPFSPPPRSWETHTYFPCAAMPEGSTRPWWLSTVTDASDSPASDGVTDRVMEAISAIVTTARRRTGVTVVASLGTRVWWGCLYCWQHEWL